MTESSVVDAFAGGAAQAAFQPSTMCRNRPRPAPLSITNSTGLATVWYSITLTASSSALG